jgi:anti-sigma-K factor RskA
VTNDNPHELAALYVVGALTPDETREFETHLSDCVICQEEVAEMRSVTERLSRSVLSDPPPSLRDAVLAGIAETEQDEPATRSDNVTPLRRGPVSESRGPSWPSRLPYLVAAASVLLALGCGGWALQNRDDAQQASAEQSQIVDALSAPDVQTVTGTTNNGVSATVVLSRSQKRALLVVNGLPTLPDNKVYELWTIKRAPVPAGTFTPTSSASLVSLPQTALSSDRIAMTVEPAGGSAHPTTPPLMTLSLT